MDAEGPSRVVGQWIPVDVRRDRCVHRHKKNVAGVGGRVQSGALIRSRNRKDLGCTQILTESLIFTKVEGLAAAVIDVRKDYGAAIGEAKLISLKGWNETGNFRVGVIEVVASVEGGVANELEHRAMEAAAA